MKWLLSILIIPPCVCLALWLMCRLAARLLWSCAKPTIIRRKGEEGYIITDGVRIKLVLPTPPPGTQNPFLDDDGNLKGFVPLGSGTKDYDRKATRATGDRALGYCGNSKRS